MEFAFYICGLIAILATLRVITHTNPVHALLYLDYFAAGDLWGVLLTGRLLRRCAGNYRLCGCHYGAVRVRGDDAQPGRFRNRTGTPVAETAGVDWSGNFVSHHAGGDCLRHSRC